MKARQISYPVILLCGFLLLLSVSVSANAQDEKNLQRGTHNSARDLQGMVRKWVDLQREQASAERAWKSDKELLKDEIQALQNQKHSLASELQQLSPGNAAAARELQDLAKANREADKALQYLAETISQAEKELLAIRTSLPGFLDAQLSQKFHAMQAQHKDDGTASAERMQRITAILSDLNEAHSRLHVSEIILQPSGNSKIEMQALYIGLARAFAVSPDGRRAAIGTPGKNGWTWRWDDAIAPSVQTAIAVTENEETAKFVSLPFAVNSMSRRAAETTLPTETRPSLPAQPSENNHRKDAGP